MANGLVYLLAGRAELRIVAVESEAGPDRRHIGGMGVTIGAAAFREERRLYRTPIAAVFTSNILD
jgi:hypothetical protein